MTDSTPDHSSAMSTPVTRRERRRPSNDQREFESELAAAQLAQTIDPDTPLPAAPLAHTRVSEVIDYLAQRWKISLSPVSIDEARSPMNQACQVLDAARVRYRHLTLESEWWTGNVPPMVVENDSGLALVLPGRLLQPVLHRPNQVPQKVTAEVAAGIRATALEVFRPLPKGTVGIRDLMRFSLSGLPQDLALVAFPAILAGAITLAIPIATAVLFDQIVPTGNTSRLIAIVVALLGLAVAASLLTYTRMYHVVRTGDHVVTTTSAAVFDRILRVPLSQLRDWPSARLTGRISIIGNTVADAIDTALSVALVSGAITVLNGILLVALIPPLGLLALALGAALLSVAFVLARKEGSLHTQEKSTKSHANRILLDILRGWIPVRTSAGEVSAFGRWAAAYAQYRNDFGRRWGVEVLIEVLRVVLLGSSIIVFVIAAYFLPVGSIASGQFLAFISAFGAFGVGLTGLITTMRAFFAVRTDLDRLSPLLALPVESSGRHEDPGTLDGEINVRGLGFRYSTDMPWVLKDINFTVQPGTFTAIVGTSGSGKSTLLRLLLGFEKPQTGAILYDGADLESLEIGAVRRQFGVVLQSSLLLPGTLRDNITIASGPLSDDQIMRVCAGVKLDQTIEDLPQGLDTIIDEGSTLISGGQRQRVLLARALAANPAILFLDEATSALDNITQRAIAQTIESVGATRIVIAHRLSTIERADNIIVLDGGRIVESGNFEQLMENDGIFAEFARRQEL